MSNQYTREQAEQIREDDSGKTNCAGKVQGAWASRREDLEMMLDPKPEFLTIAGYAPLPTEDRWVVGYGETSFEAHVNADDLFDEHEDAIREAGYDAFHEYGLAFDYVAPETFKDQDEGYWRFLISYGGPSEEIRFYADSRSGHVYRAEFWYLDWFDGAKVIVTGDEIVEMVWNSFFESGTVEHVYDEAMGNME